MDPIRYWQQTNRCTKMDMYVCEDTYAAAICISTDKTFHFQSDGEMLVPP